MPTVLGVQKLHDEGEAYLDRTGRKYTEVYLVTFDAKATYYEARTASGLPTFGSTYSEDTYAKFLSKSVSKTASRKVWRVTVNYSTPNAETPEDDPLDDPVQIAWGPRPRTVVASKDKDGNAILNSAYDAFDPPPEDEDYEQTLTISRNESTAAPDTMEEYQGSVNSASVTIAGKTIAARKAKLVEWTATKQVRNGHDYYAHTYRIEIKSDTWDLSLLDHGLYYTDSSGVKRRVMEDGKPAEDPQLLDGSGGLLLAYPATPTPTGDTYSYVAVGFGAESHIDALAFGNVYIGRSSVAVLKIYNSTASAITVTSIAGLASPYASEPSGTVSWSIPAGGFKTVTVQYAPQAAGAHSDTLVITTSVETHNIALTGTGVARPTEVYRTFRRRKEKAWSSLSLPTTA